MFKKKKVKVKWSRYRPGVAQRVGRCIALLFHDRGTRRGWVVSSTPRPHFTPGKEPVSILQETGWAPGPVWTGGKSHPHRDSIPDRPARSQSLYRLSYPAHKYKMLSSLNIDKSMKNFDLINFLNMKKYRILKCYVISFFFLNAISCLIKWLEYCTYDLYKQSSRYVQYSNHFMRHDIAFKKKTFNVTF